MQELGFSADRSPTQTAAPSIRLVFFNAPNYQLAARPEPAHEKEVSAFIFDSLLSKKTDALRTRDALCVHLKSQSLGRTREFRAYWRKLYFQNKAQEYHDPLAKYPYHSSLARDLTFCQELYKGLGFRVAGLGSRV